jgi:hypothetical protein
MLPERCKRLYHHHHPREVNMKPTTTKRPYAPPKLTDHGDVLKQTTGLTGPCWELIGSNWGDPIPPPEPDEEEVD